MDRQLHYLRREPGAASCIAAITIGGAIIGSIDDSSFAFTSHETRLSSEADTIPHHRYRPGVFFSWETGGMLC